MLNIRFIVALLLVFVSLLISICGGWTTKNIAEQLMVTTALVVNSATPEQRADNADLLKKNWENKKQVLSLFLDNSKCEQLGSLIVQACVAAEQADEVTVNAICEQLLQQLNNIAQQEEITIYNLF